MDYSDTIFQRFAPHHNQIFHLDLFYYKRTGRLNKNLSQNTSHQQAFVHRTDLDKPILSNLVTQKF